jgi:dihydropteroate synthase
VAATEDALTDCDATAHRTAAEALFEQQMIIAPRSFHRVTLNSGQVLELGRRTLVMGIVNVTPDSFAEPGPRGVDDAVRLALALEAEGADILDIGGESTRPGAGEVPAEEELARVLPVIEALVPVVKVPISVDTYKAKVAAAAMAAGATIINDISGLRYDPTLGDVAARTSAALVLMHTRGRSRDMYREAVYHDVVTEIVDELGASLSLARRAGVEKSRVLLDPGLGFAKAASQSYEALAGLPLLSELGCPLMVGPSRKSFLGNAPGTARPADRDWGTAAAVTAAILFGAHVVRVHAVRPMADVVRVADTIRKYGGG